MSKKNPQAQPEIAPQTNPDAGKRATVAADGVAAAAPFTPAIKTKTRVEGSELVADIEKHSVAAGVGKRYRYWIGVTPSCPVNGLDIAGLCFPKVNEQIVPDPGRTGQKKRRLVAGAIVWVTEDKIRLLRERLPRTVIRFTDDKGTHNEPGTGENIGDVAQRPRRGHVITIPTDEDLKSRQQGGKPAHAYNPDPKRDVPAARFMFAQLCANQAQPEQGEYDPDPLELTGLEWPEELAELDKLLR